MNVLRRFGRWSRRHSQTIAYVWLTVLFVGAMSYTQLNYRQDCVDRRDARNAVRGLVILATSQPGIDYSRFPSFAELDTETQTFLLEVQQAQMSGSLSDFRAQALAALHPIDCS